MTHLTDELFEKNSTKINDLETNPGIKVKPANERVGVTEIIQKTEKKLSNRDNNQHPETTTFDSMLKFLRWTSDRPGQSAVMLMLLILTLSFQFQALLWLIPASLAVLVIRAVSYQLFSQQNILNHRGVRTTIKQVAKEEGLIGIAFVALCFLFNFPPSAFDIVLFLVANLVAQGAITAVLKELVFDEPNSKLTWPASKQQSIIIVGTGNLAKNLANNIIDHSELATRIDGFVDFERTGLYRYRDIPLLGHPDQIETIIGEKQVDLLLIALEPDKISLTYELFNSAETMGIPIGLACDWYKAKITRPISPKIGHIPVISYHSAPKNRVMLTIKAALDRVLALLGLVLVSPIMLATCCIIRIESKGPVFFIQIRSGTNGKPFKMLKFRTMCNEAEDLKEQLSDQNEMSGPVFKISSDPRITRFGHYLRKFSIDELPQLINILKGEMSLVGPRPPLPKEVTGMESWQRRKLSVKPGVTCIWQVSGRNAIDFEEWMKLDLEYIDNWSLWTDVKLIARTIPTVIKGSGS